MAKINYNGTEIITTNVISVSPVVEVVQNMATSYPVIKYGFNIVTAHSVIKSPLYETSTAADSARTSLINSL